MSRFNAFMIMCLILFLNHTQAFGAPRIESKTILVTEWGSKEGQFGWDNSGKMPYAQAVQISVANDMIYLLDGVNDRIQIFSQNGKLERVVKLSTHWEKGGLPFRFTVLNDEFYFFKGLYLDETGKEIHKYSSNGVYINSFGKLRKSYADEGYHSLYTNHKHKYILTNMWPDKIIAYNSDGKDYKTLFKSGAGEEVYIEGMTYEENPILIIFNNKLKKSSAIIYNINDNTTVNIPTKFDLLGSNNILYRIKTEDSKNGKYITTFNCYEISKKSQYKIEIEAKSEFKLKNNERLFDSRCSGKCNEEYAIDSAGNIYHLITMNQGLVLKKYTITH